MFKSTIFDVLIQWCDAYYIKSTVSAFILLRGKSGKIIFIRNKIRHNFEKKKIRTPVGTKEELWSRNLIRHQILLNSVKPFYQN